MFLPISKIEMKKLGWDRADIILVTGDAYIDSPYIGVALLGKHLMNHGLRVAIISQPDYQSDKDITRLGEPKLFWGVTAGSVDSMVANYTPSGKKRHSDDYTPGGQNNKRPDRATLIYANLIRRYFKDTQPIVLGGIEASLRRIAHYDFWSNRVRRSILLDAKADYLIYGMGEKSTLELALALRDGSDVTKIRGLCYINRSVPDGYLRLPDYETVVANKTAFSEMFMTFYHETDPITAKGLAQKYGNRFLIQNPPAYYLSSKELDTLYGMNFEYRAHPSYDGLGKIKALDTIRFSINSHRGCYGECHFCAITMHQGRTVRWRSEKSILDEAKKMTTHPEFKGIISDVGGPTANMYGFECEKKLHQGICRSKRCIYPSVCRHMPNDHQPQIQLLKKLRRIPQVRKVFVTSGLRYDMLIQDSRHGETYLLELVQHHVSGQMKIAPEHISNSVLQLMGKPSNQKLAQFKHLFDKLNQKTGKKQFLTYYFIAAHPGCTNREMEALKQYVSTELKMQPEQVQIFTPTPSTLSTLMYYTEKDPFTGKSIFVEKTLRGKVDQKNRLVRFKSTSRRLHSNKTSHSKKKKTRSRHSN